MAVRGMFPRGAGAAATQRLTPAPGPQYLSQRIAAAKEPCGRNQDNGMLRPPKSPNASRRPQTGVAELDHEILGEMASALGHAGRRAEESLARLAAHEGGDNRRAVLLKEAADAVHAYFIQRELCGMKRHEAVIRDMGIPRQVLARLGAR